MSSVYTYEFTTSKYSASLIIRHPMNNNEIISLKNFGMLRSCDVAELLVTTDTSSEATESEVKHVKITGGSVARILILVTKVV